ncbi:allantoicase [Spongisporangium articulatum]|uniref:Probable allantoicase n=1 Tax=Spongisporangium articulatum TaxID=3362603 RepID=A0ABW8AGZ5_9ACTN
MSSPLSEPIDLASSAIGGRVVYANDELFADRRHLIRPEPSAWQPDTYGPDGKIYDGWETRRRRDGGERDFAIVRLGAPGVLRSVVVDTAHFRGNYPPYASLEGLAGEGHPIAQEAPEGAWTTLVEKSALKGDSENSFDVVNQNRWSHVRLSIYPDGGVARLRVLGDVVPDPRLLTGTVDLAALWHGGRVVGASNMFYGSAGNLIRPGETRTIGEGWETARRRDGGHDWVLFQLSGAGRIRRAEIDTTHFTGNAPGEVRLVGVDGRVNALEDASAWHELMPRTRLRPDTLHRFVIRSEAVTHVRMEVFPDGGMSRVRLFGELEPDALEGVMLQWLRTVPSSQLNEVLGAVTGLTDEENAAMRHRRPFPPSSGVPAAVRSYLLD